MTPSKYREPGRWINARYAGRCRCGEPIIAGDKVWYYRPPTTILCASCGAKLAVIARSREADASDARVFDKATRPRGD